MNPSVRNARTEQIEFHRNVDVARYWNRIDNPFLRRKESALARLVAERIPPQGRVLEVGCGEGSNLWYLSRERPACRLLGVDFSVAKLEFLREMHPTAKATAADALLT